MLERLRQLEHNLVNLETLHKQYKYTDLESSINLQWALRYGIIESIQIVIDLA
ncbi:MAG: hypothetical protein KKI09_08605 [Spirochaetes bacterium]|nr:hypothetical protein [Spirochaetota bacterium]